MNLSILYMIMGASLFYEDTEEIVKQAIADPETYAASFGYSGTYWDYAREIAIDYGGLKDLINLNLSEVDVSAVLREAGFTGYRFSGVLGWIMKAVEMLVSLR